MNVGRPLGDWVIVEPISQADVKSNIIAMPERSKTDDRVGMKIGRVLATGPGLVNLKTDKRFPVEVSVDDIILYAQVGCFERFVDGVRVDIVSERNILLTGLDDPLTEKPVNRVSDGFPILTGKPLTREEKKHGRRY